MKFIWFIAFRYLFSKKRFNAINLISIISVIGVTTGTAALIVLLSAFNGLESWVVKLYDTFDPDIKIEHTTKKFFAATPDFLQKIEKTDGIKHAVPVIEENALITFGDAQFIATLKGVGRNYDKVSAVRTSLIDGRYSLNSDSAANGLFGSGVAYALGFNTRSFDTPVEIFVPRPGASLSLNPTEAFNSSIIQPHGIFQIQPEVDLKYVLTSYGYASDLFNRPQMASSIEVKLETYKDAAEVSALLKKNLGAGYKISNRFEQHQLLYKIIKSEKWAVYLILTFILVIAVFNITGSLTMLIVDKSKDINTLRSMGANTRHLLAIFFTEGMMICLLGVLLGSMVGVGIVIAQDLMGLVYISDVDPYPVLLKVSDIGLTVATVLSIGTLASWLPANRLIKQKKHL